MIKKLNICASIFVLLSLGVMSTTEEHLLSLCFAMIAFCCFGTAIGIHEHMQSKKHQIKGMLYNNKHIVKF